MQFSLSRFHFFFYGMYLVGYTRQTGVGVGSRQRRRYEYAGPRADHDGTGPEYRYLDWYATANTDYVLTRSTFATWRTNLVFSLFIIFFPFCGQRFLFLSK